MEWSFPWLSIDGDRMYDDSDFSRFFEGLFSYGVSLTTANALKVTVSPNGGMKVQVDSGYSFTGKVFLNSSAKALSIDVASSTQDRTDSIVVRMDKSVRDVFLAVKKNDTTVTRTSDVYELQLATIRVPRNVSSITGDLITDKRADEKVCGYSSPFQKVNVSGLE
ncbi:TPA: structural protein, partial [Enterococcus faecalis]|nr:structural protein [Enterococcus faecalis]